MAKTKEMLPPPRLVKNPEGNNGRDIVDSDMNQLYQEEKVKFNKEREDLIKVDVAIRILIKEGVVKEKDNILTLLHAIDLRIYDLIRSLKSIIESDADSKNRGDVPSADDTDAEFRDLMDTEEIKVYNDVPFLKTVVETIRRLCKTGELDEKDTVKTAM